MIRKSLLPAVVFSLVLLSGCAGGQLMKIGGTSDEIPKDLPKELQEKFEVKDAAALANPQAQVVEVAPAEKAKAELVPADAVAKAPTPKKKPRRGKKGAKAEPVSATAGAPGAFAYPSRRPSVDPIWPDERFVYDISYLGMSAGEFNLHAEPFKFVGSRKAYHFRGIATTTKVFALFYRMNDMVETFMDFDGLFSQRFHIDLDESKQTRDSLELNDSEKAQTYYWNRWHRSDAPYSETKEWFPISPFSQDSLSALYYIRMQPLKDGDVFQFPVINEGKTWTAVVTVLGREEVDTPMGRIRAIKVKPEAQYQGVLKKEGDSFFWFSDDERHFLVRLEAKVKVGTVTAKLKRVEPGTQPAQ